MDHYKLSQFEKVQIVEKKLSQEITELKDEIEESEMIFGKNVRPLSSVSMPMDAHYFSEERKLAIYKALDVSGAARLKCQSQTILDELESCFQSDITVETLPLLLHQFFLNQMQSFVQCNHMHMLRWRRFCKHTEAIERIYPKYRQRLNAIKKDYEDARHRAQRLSTAYQSYLLKDNKASRCLRSDDVAVFFRWLVVHLHSVKKVFGYLKLLQWLPVIHRSEIDLHISAPLHSVSEGNLGRGSEWKENIKTMADVEHKPPWTNITAGLDFSYLSPTSTPLRSSRDAPSMTPASELAFSGIVSNEVTLGLPCHVTELNQFRPQLESLTAEYGIAIRTELTTSADEMELFGAVNRHFKSLFNRQLECLTFHPYDNPPEGIESLGYEHWGVDSASHCLKKSSNWIKHVQMKPKKEAHQLRQMTYLKEHGNIDELLRSQNRFLNVSDFAQVTEALKEHAVAVREPPRVQAVSVASNQRGKLKTISVWDRVYENAEKHSTNKLLGSEKSKEGGDRKSSSQNKRKESYDYTNTMQMLGLDEGDDSSNQDPTVIQGAYLSFLHLRHLKIKDLKRQCLAILNYFRSIERTITIYDGGLSEGAESPQEDEKETVNNQGKKRKTKSSSRAAERPGNRKSNQAVGGKGQFLGIGSHQYIYNTPADYKIELSRFMEFTAVENHDDFYSLDSELEGQESGEGGSGEWKSSITSAAVSTGSLGADSTPHVQDHRGYFIMYNSALRDLKDLDEELVLVASQYIEKDSANRSKADGSDIPGEINISSYAHRDVDRFAVLHDLWMCELNFLVNKRKLMDVLVEAYQTTFEDSERSNVAQLITDLLYQRPRYDFTDAYFIRTYRGECACLRLKTTLLSQILISHMDDCKHYLSKVTRPSHSPGMPLFTNARQEVSVNLPKPSLRHVDMLEFHPTAGMLACRVSESLDSAIRRMMLVHRPSCMGEEIALEKQVLEHAQREWDGMTPMGSSFSKQIQKDLFAEDFVEDVYILNDAVQSLFKTTDEVDASKAKEEDEAKMKIWTRAVDVVLLRHRFLEAAWDTEVLSRLYKRMAKEIGYDEFHLYLRLLQFEFASRKEKIDPSPTMMSNFIVDDMSADRYVPNTLILAALELDENHLSKFSFRNREGFLQLIQSSNALENFRTALACQVAHKNALTVAVTLAENCAKWKDAKPSANYDSERRLRDSFDSRSNISLETSTSQMTSTSRLASPPVPKKQQLSSANLNYGYEKQKRSPEAFLSIQLEKLGPRDAIVNSFIRKKEIQGLLLKKEGELEKLKRSLVSDFCKEFSFRMSLHAKRAQIITSYSGILNALELFPSTRNNFFLLGRANEKKRKLDDVTAMVPDPKVFQKRPRRVMSPDGKCFMNLWFIPHYTEVLNSYRNLDYEVQSKILETWLVIASSLHDIILHLCARARLGSSSSLHKSGRIGYTVSADWGGAEGIGSHCSEIQEQINSLDPGPSPYTQDPSKVAELLSSKKSVLSMTFDAAVRHSIRESFLAMDNVRAYQSVSNNMHFGLPPLTDAWEASVTCLGLQLPQPLDPDTEDARSMYPWLSFQHCNGQHPTLYAEHWEDPEPCMQLCLAGLNDIERQLANGELLGVSVLLQEVLNNGTVACKSLKGPSTDVSKGFFQQNPIGKIADTKPASATSSDKKKKDVIDENKIELESEKLKTKSPERFSAILPLNKTKFPIDAFKLMSTFLRLWKQLEVFKLNWGKLKLNTKSISSPALYREFNRIYRAEILLPVYTAIARSMGKMEMYVEIASDDLPLSPPPGAPELSVRALVLIKLLELCELNMVSDTRLRIAKEYTLVLAERSRDETALPADLWRQHQGGSESSMRESFVVSRPHFVDDFIRKLMSECKSENGHVIFDKTHLNDAVAMLAADVMKRERENYESYSIYYENLLRHHHRLLYVKELEMKAADFEQAGGSASADSVQAQFQLADRTHELILEITALRAKVSEMREKIMTMDQDIREDVRRDYQGLVQNLFEACFQMKSRLALCHLSIHDDVRNLISDTRSEAMKSLGRLKNEAPSSTAQERLLTIAAKEKQVHKLQEEQHNLNKLVIKLNALNHWKQSNNAGRYKLTVEKLRQEVANTRRDCFTKTQIAKEEAELRFEELQAARKSLEGSNQKLMKTHEQMERDKKLQKEKEYKELQEQRNRKQLTLARQRDMERMMIELQEKDKRLKSLTSDVERHNKLEQTNQTRIQRSLKQMHNQLSIERSLKLDAFDRVDNLQAQVFDAERDIGLLGSSRPTSATFSVSKSGVAQRSRNLTVPTTPITPKVKVRPMSCVPLNEVDRSVSFPKKRPQTAANTLRNRIAAAILTEVKPPTDEHETVVRLGRVVQ